MLSIQLSDETNKSTLTNCYLIITMLVVLGLWGCSETSVNPDQTSTSPDQVYSSNEISPHSVLSSISTNNDFGYTAKSKARGGPMSSSDGFTGPLFGLTTAPNGDILVADAGAGVFTLNGTEEI